ncbi:MAG TPA: hypothetical protein VHD56_08605 [Tepidisphaeraceae bacterium]|nr:hypothetical protein [Tepidisphaeraceae bacterium]
MTNEEVARIKRIQRRSWIDKILGRKRKELGRSQWLAEVYRITVERCFIPMESNEESPLYLLDVGGALLILFGPWLNDPHVLKVQHSTINKWDCEHSFFTNFTIRCDDQTGIVFELSVETEIFIEAQCITTPLRFKQLRESQLVVGGSETLVHDLENVGILYNDLQN